MKSSHDDAVLADAARALGWSVSDGIAVKPCPKIGLSSALLENTCYAHGENLHCPCCCNGTLVAPVIRKKEKSHEK